MRVCAESAPVLSHVWRLWRRLQLISDMTTVICLDDYHSNDRAGRKVSGMPPSSSSSSSYPLLFFLCLCKSRRR